MVLEFPPFPHIQSICKSHQLRCQNIKSVPFFPVFSAPAVSQGTTASLASLLGPSNIFALDRRQSDQLKM